VDNGIRFKKTKDPAPGSYNIEESIRKSQWAASNIHVISKGKKKDFLEINARAKSAIPGVGKYKDTEKGYQILSKPPTSLMRRR
jgi:hypothetical protein